MLLQCLAVAFLSLLVCADELGAPDLLPTHHAACDLLAKTYPAQALLPGSEEYKIQSQTQTWSLSNILSPACIFAPQDAEQLASAVQTFTSTNTQFAVRSGGHMPVQNANSIAAPGVLVALSNMTHLHLCNETNVMEIGPGNRWQAVYDYLEPMGRVVVGGRDGRIGVGGFLLGGGISYHSGENGFAAKNIVGYECVLANGTLATVTADNAFADLFHALQTGGGSSFCLVTRFHLTTYPTSEVFIGTSSYADYYSTQFLDASTSFANQSSFDPKSSLTSIMTHTPATNLTSYLAVQFYDSDNDKPMLWQNFTTPYMGAVFSDYRRQTLASYLRTSNAADSTRKRQVWRTWSMKVDRVGLGLVNEILIGMTGEELSEYTDVSAGIVVSRVTQGTIGWEKAEGQDKPVWIVVLQLSCEKEEEYAVLLRFADRFVSAVEKRLKHGDLLVDYKYLNYAGEGQQVFESLGQDKLAELKAVREKYDPTKVFTELMPGGWKVGS